MSPVKLPPSKFKLNQKDIALADTNLVTYLVDIN